MGVTPISKPIRCAAGLDSSAPRLREGDRQVPEGFYSITPAQMNPNSAYYLSFNIGYPNAYDRALGHTAAARSWCMASVPRPAASR